MLQSEINMCDLNAVDHRPLHSRLNAGLSMMDHHDSESPSVRHLIHRNSAPVMEDEDWEIERLNPKTCNLRYAHIVCEGVPTGQTTIAQESTPPCHRP